MAIEVTESRTSISFSYDTDVVKGDKIEILARNPASGDEFESKKNVKNDGSGAVAFPAGYSGDCEILVKGSDSGEDSGVIQVNP